MRYFYCSKCGFESDDEDKNCSHYEFEEQAPYLLIAHSEESYDYRYQETIGINHFEVAYSLTEEQLVKEWISQYKMVSRANIQVFFRGIRVFDGKYPQESFRAIYDKVVVLIEQERNKESERIKAIEEEEARKVIAGVEAQERQMLIKLKDKYEKNQT